MIVVIPTATSLAAVMGSGDLDRALAAGHRVVAVDAAAEAGPYHPGVEIVGTDVWRLLSDRRASGATPKANAAMLAAADYLTADDGLRRLVDRGDRVVLVLDADWWVSPSAPGNLTVTTPDGLAAALAG
jgi:hypothetical protein